jgi:hypothetical protein
MKTFKDLINAPDQDEDPDGFHEFDKRMSVLQAEEKKDQELRAAKTESEQKRYDARTAEFTRQLDALSSEHKWTDQQRASEAGAITALIMGDPVTGRLPSDSLKRLHFAARMDEILAAKDKEFATQLDEATKKAKAEGIESFRKAQRDGATLPSFESGGDVEPSDDQKYMQNLLRDIGADQQENDWLEMMRKR